VDVARDRRGKQFDPILVDTFCAAAGDVLDGIDSLPEWDALIDGEPGLQRCLSDDELDAALVAVADYTDLRSRARSGHSRGVASLAAEAGALSGLPAGEVRNLRRAGLVHDIGLHGVPATILDKAGPLTGTERERLRMSAYYTERTLARPLRWPGSVPSPPWPASGWTGPDTTAVCRGRPSRWRGGSWPRLMSFIPRSNRAGTGRRCRSNRPLPCCGPGFTPGPWTPPPWMLYSQRPGNARANVEAVLPA
jgi:hypothetical protein